MIRSIVSNQIFLKMRYQIILPLNNLAQTLHVISGTFKNWQVWKVQFENGEEATLFKHMEVWMQRNEDNLDHQTITAIGQQIDRINTEISLTQNRV